VPKTQSPRINSWDVGKLEN